MKPLCVQCFNIGVVLCGACARKLSPTRRKALRMLHAKGWPTFVGGTTNAAPTDPLDWLATVHHATVAWLDGTGLAEPVPWPDGLSRPTRRWQLTTEGKTVAAMLAAGWGN